VEKLYKEYGNRIEFIGINMGLKGNVDEFVKKYGLTFPVAYDEGSKLASVFGAKIETNIFIDRKGLVKFKERGFPDDIEKHLKKLSEQ